MRFFRRWTIRDWPALVAELVLIFAGITAALWFDDLNQAREESRREASVLAEVASAFESDTTDLNFNLRSSASTLASIDTVLRRLEQRLPYTEGLDAHFAQAAGVTIFIHNSAAYEHLKIAGLDLLRDDSLRLGIVDYYERRVQLVRQWEDWIALPV